MNSHEVFIHIHQGCFAGTGAIVRSSNNNMEGRGVGVWVCGVGVWVCGVGVGVGVGVETWRQWNGIEGRSGGISSNIGGWGVGGGLG